MAPSDRHRRHAARFGGLVAGVTDWTAPAPVTDWRAVDVLDHLVDWSADFLAAGGVEVTRTPDRDTDPVGGWNHHADAVQALLDGPDPDREFTHPYLGPQPLDQAIDRFYTTDVFMHTWDLARATGQDDRLDLTECADLLAGMRPIEDLLRSSGQYGPAVAVPSDADAQDQLLGFIGRDPGWAPPAV